MESGAVFFDRDGVLVATSVVDGVPIADNNPEKIEFMSGAIQLCQRLHLANIKTFMVTNQPDIARGKIAFESVDGVNSIVKERCNLTDVAVCPHDDLDQCECRKPRPGMVVDLAARYGVELSRSVVVGDRWRDIEAGKEAGCSTIFINYEYGEKMPSEPTHIVSSVEQVGLLLEKYFDLRQVEGQ